MYKIKKRIKTKGDMCDFIKNLFKKKEKSCPIHGLDCKEDFDCHWSVDWDKATYQICEISNDNGIVGYRVYRTLFGLRKEITGLFDEKTMESALEVIKENKEFYKENNNSIFTRKEKWIDID